MELPRERTSFVGRTHELSAIESTFGNRGRLLTLLGAPGVGKTRLALHYASAWARRGESVWFCDLSGAHTESDVVTALAQAVDVELGERDAAERALAQRLGAVGAALLVLDNVEQVAGPAASLVERWLDELPELSWLVTSRQRLDVAGEEVLDLAPLPLSDAAQLFKERADAVAKGRSVARADDAVAALVARLDGIPLAVELAAARTRVLSPELLLERLSERLDPGGGDARGAATFLRTLEKAIGWSWSMLDEGERRALCRASVFAASFDLDAAFAVVGDDALEHLAALVDKSLINVEPHGRATRYRLFESIRAYATARLDESGEREEVEDRHASVYLDDARGPVLAEADGSRAALYAERDNVLAVHRRGLARGRTDLVVGAADRLCDYYLQHGPLSSHQAVVEQAVQAAEASGDDAQRERAWLLRGQLSVIVGRHDAAWDDLELARDGAVVRGDKSLEARARRYLARLSSHAGRFEEARKDATSSHRLHKQVGQERLAAGVQLDLASACGIGGRREEARRLARGALLTAENAGDRTLQAAALEQLGTLAARDGDRHAARGYWGRAKELWRDLSAHRRVGDVDIKLGRLAYEEGQLDEAHALLDEGRETVRRIAGASGTVAEATALLGAVALERGDLEGADNRTADAAAWLAGAGDPLEAFVLALRGATLCAQGDVGAARDVFEEVDAAIARGVRDSVARAAHTLRAPLLAKGGDAAAARARLDEAGDVRLGSRVRVARRFADKAMAFGAAAQGGAVVGVADDGSWLETPGSERVDLSRRRVLRRLLLALAEKRVQEPGSLLASADLVAAGWPGERMLEKSAQDRLWVAIRSLRRLGLDGILVTGREGYLLDPDVPLELRAAQAA